MSGRNPLFADLPLGTIITDEMRLERLKDTERFKDRKFRCFVCGERLEFAGRPSSEPDVFLFFCPTCEANVEYRKLGV
jgi:hypothetical protein